MNQFKIGDRVRAVKDCSDKHPKKGWKGKVTKPDYTYCPTIEVLFDNGQRWWAFPDEIELIESTPNPFPTEDEFITWVQNLNGNWMLHNIYNYFAQFQYEKTVEVFPEVNKLYEFSMDGKDWQQAMLISYAIRGLFEHNYALYIRPIQPTRLEQLKAKHPNLTNDELIELLDILLTQMRE
jgi:hypothetical protein